MISGICPNCELVTDFTDIPPFTRVKCSNCGTELIVPEIFGNFQLTDIIKEYPIIKNYKAHNLTTDEPVTIAILNKNFSSFRECLNICRKEAKELSSVIKHYGIVPVIEYGEHNNTFYAVSPDIEGNKLSEYDPKQYGEFEAKSIFHAFKAIAAILKEAHRSNFEHHNICPENILIDNEGRIKILNFFISRLIYTYESSIKAESSVSPYYISPEKVEKGMEDSKGDIFSLGITLYYMLTGQYPFDGANKDVIIYSRVKRRHSKSSTIPYKPPKHIDALRTDIPIEYGDFIDELLMPYPVQRPTAIGIINKLSLIEADLERQKSFEFYSKAVSFQANTKSKVNTELNKAIKNDQLNLEYQPIISLENKNIIGLEALIRWPNSPVGNLAPVNFIPETQDSGLIHELGMWVLNKACMQLHEWIKLGYTNLYITVNVSPTQLKDANFSTNIDKLLQNYNIDHTKIEFEIADINTASGERLQPEEYINFAKSYNSRVSVIEFGDKFSALKNELEYLKLNSIKIDNYFIKEIKKSKKEISNFKSIITLASYLSTITVADRVENQQQINFLKKIGCSAVQGYYYFRPMPPEMIVDLLN